MDENEFNQWRVSANKYALNNINSEEIKAQYHNMFFNINSEE